MSDNGHNPPEWLTEGAPVVPWNSNRVNDESPEAVVTTVKKVSKASFSVEAEGEPRIYFVGMRSTRQGSRWHGYHRLADSPSSTEAQRALAKTTRAQLKQSASRAVHAWDKNDNGDTLTAALVALVALAKADGIRPDGTESKEA